MGPPRAFRDRDEKEVAVLEALIERREEGLTVFELRTHADVDIDDLEAALRGLKDDNLITVKENGDRTVIIPDPSVLPEPGEEDGKRTIVGRILDRLPF